MNAVFAPAVDTYDPAVDPTPGGQGAVTAKQAEVKDKFYFVTDTYTIDIQAGTRIRIMPTTVNLTTQTMRRIREDMKEAMGDDATELVDTMVLDMRHVDHVEENVTVMAAEEIAAEDWADLYFGMTNVAYVQFDGEQDTLVDDVVAATESPEFSSHVLVVDGGLTVDDYGQAFETEVEEKLHLHQRPAAEPRVAA